MLLLKLGALLSFLGGPLYASDRLRATFDPRLAFALAFAPLGLVLMGTLTLDDDDHAVSRLFVRAGLVGAALLLLQNGWLLYGLLIAHDSENPGLHVAGGLTGMLVASAYAHFGHKRLRTGFVQLRRGFRLPPRVGDWLALAICSAGAASAPLMYQRDPDGSVTVFILFGGMAAFMALHLRGWRRFERDARRPRALVMRDDTTLRPARARVLSAFGVLFLYGALLSHFGHGFAAGFRWITVSLAALGALGVLLALLGVVPPGRLRFAARALFVRTWHYTLEIPWHCITAVYVREFYGNRMICLQFEPLSEVRTEPPEAWEKAHRALARNALLTGAPLMFASQLYAVEANALVAEIERRARGNAAGNG